MSFRTLKVPTGTRYITFLCLFVFLAGVVSCKSIDREFGGPPETNSSELEQPKDIPAPEEADFQKHQSYLHYPTGRKARVAKFIYYSDQSMSYLEEFYRENMRYGWEPAEHNPEGTGTIHFVSSNELCKINMEKLPETRRRRLNKEVKIIIEIEPIE